MRLSRVLQCFVASSLAFAPAAFSLTYGFPYGSQKVRGVNLGGWLVLEVCIYWLTWEIGMVYKSFLLSLGSPHHFLTTLATLASSTNTHSANSSLSPPLSPHCRTTGTRGLPKLISQPSLLLGEYPSCYASHLTALRTRR